MSEWRIKEAHPELYHSSQALVCRWLFLHVPKDGPRRAHETRNTIIVVFADSDAGKFAIGIPFQGRIPYFSVPPLTVESRRDAANLDSRPRPIHELAIPRMFRLLRKTTRLREDDEDELCQVGESTAQRATSGGLVGSD